MLPSIGAITALTILAEAGALRRFHHPRQFLKYCGLDLAKSQSGQSKGHELLSKRGEPRVKRSQETTELRKIAMVLPLASIAATTIVVSQIVN